MALNRGHNSTKETPSRESRKSEIVENEKRAKFWAVRRRGGPWKGPDQPDQPDQLDRGQLGDTTLEFFRHVQGHMFLEDFLTLPEVMPLSLSLSLFVVSLLNSCAIFLICRFLNVFDFFDFLFFLFFLFSFFDAVLF